MVIALYTVLFHSEENDRNKVPENSEVTSLTKMLKISVGLMMNKNMILLVSFFVAERCFASISYFMGRLYLLDELNYSQEKLSFLTLILFPLNITVSLVVAKISNTRPLMFYYVCQFIQLAASLVIINVVYFNFADIQSSSPFLLDSLLFCFLFVMEFTEISIFTTRFAFINKICDINVAATHVTLFASLANFAQMIPRIYTYKIVDMFGIFTPNLIGCCITIGIMIIYYPIIQKLEKVPKQKWWFKEQETKSHLL